VVNDNAGAVARVLATAAQQQPTGSMNWTAIAAIATGVMAIATFFMALRTGKVARETKQLAEEARSDRDLAWRPILALEQRGGVTRSGNPQQTLVSVRVTNLGSGPALSCSIYVSYEGCWGCWNGFPLKPQEHRDMGIHVDANIVFPSEVFTLKAGTQRTPTTRMMQLPPELAAVCTDALGRRWRFLPGLPNQKVEADDPKPPAWVIYCR